jgi:drug/metabolite transporter (DMT)-like permease
VCFLVALKKNIRNGRFMLYLIIVSFIWAFSFGLMKGNLTGLDSSFVAATRIFLALILFLPFLRFKYLNKKLVLSFLLIGMLQYGLMYLLYIHSYQYLKAYEVALFTIFTPLFVVLISDLLARKIHVFFYLMALLAVGGSAVIAYSKLGDSDWLFGFAILQFANICFAFGQVYYRHLRQQHTELKDREVYALLYLGAFVLTALVTLVTVDLTAITLNSTQIWTLLYLGFLASGLCFFWWNVGAIKVNAGTLAVFNNVKVPAAILCSLVFFGEDANWIRLSIGGGVILLAIIALEWRKKCNA